MELFKYFNIYEYTLYIKIYLLYLKIMSPVFQFYIELRLYLNSFW